MKDQCVAKKQIKIRPTSKKKEKREKIGIIALKLKHGPRGIWRKFVKADALSQLVRGH